MLFGIDSGFLKEKEKHNLVAIYTDFKKVVFNNCLYDVKEIVLNNHFQCLSLVHYQNPAFKITPHCDIKKRFLLCDSAKGVSTRLSLQSEVVCSASNVRH